MKSVVVFCGSSSGVKPVFKAAARALGTAIAKRKLTLVYGGAKIGIMGAVANAALEANGAVIGIIPSFLRKKEVSHEGLTQLVVTANMHERKLKMHENSDAIIMLPGGFGTLEEFFEMLTWAQLGLHDYPIGILNTDGYYDSLLALVEKMVQEGFLKSTHYDLIIIERDIETLLDKMDRYEAPSAPKWINKEQL